MVVETSGLLGSGRRAALAIVAKVIVRMIFTSIVEFEAFFKG